MAKDPYKYFRIEARELLDGLVQGVLELEKGVATPEVYARLLRLGHTLKGAARVVKQPAIAEIAHHAEDVLSAQRAKQEPLGRDETTALLAQLDRAATLLRALDPAPAPEAPVQRSMPVADEEPLATLRVDIQKMDALVRSVADTSAHVRSLRRDVSTVERLHEVTRLLAREALPPRARALVDELRAETELLQRTLTSDVERVETGLTDVQDVTHGLRLIPARTVFALLERTVRDAGQELGKDVAFEARGGDVRLDAQVLASVRDALMHVVRNAVTHGIEAPATRTASNKPAQGRVELTVERRGGRVTFACKDDGAGIDIEAVRRIAIERKLLREAASADAVLSLLQTGGLSTAASITELSGRGIGLDVLRATMSQLKGETSLSTERGRGTVFEVTVPLSIASLQGLIVEIGGLAATIPLDSVRQTLRVAEADIARTANSGSILHEGKVIPFVPLDRALRQPTITKRRVWSAVVVESAGKGVAVGVDRLLGTASVVMRALPEMIAVDPVIAGATLDADGNPQMVLDPGGLVRASEHVTGVHETRDARERAPILVIDDSLTTRMLEKSILESAGYAVELATSAEEGLEKARAKRYSLFIVDVEMPGMDGFGFVAATRADPALRDTAAILVTSRNAPEDKRRGAEAGARAYVVKGEFDQGHLLAAIQRLIA